MTRSRKFLLGGIALAAVIAGVATAAAHRNYGHHGGFGPHGGRFGGDGFGLSLLAQGGGLCNGRGAEMADHMVVAMEHRLKTTDAQKPALDELKSAIKAGVAKVEASCPPKPERAADGARPPRPTPPERLARLEAGLVARLEAVRTVRPAAEKLYASLSEEQKAKVAEMGPGRRGWHGGRSGWHHGGWGRGEDAGRPDVAPREGGEPRQ